MAFPEPSNSSLLAQQFEEAGAHLKLLADKPDVQQGNLIVKALNDVNSRLGNIEKAVKDIQDAVANVHAETNALYNEKIREKAAKYNNNARDHNSGVYTYQSNTELSDLHDYRSNEPIAGFPTTVDSIRYLTDAQLTTLLEALGFTYNGATEDKRRVFREKIGMRN